MLATNGIHHPTNGHSPDERLQRPDGLHGQAGQQAPSMDCKEYADV